MVIELDPFECPKLTLLNLCLWSCLKSEVYKRKVDTRHDFIARILDAAARVKKREDQVRRTTRDLHTPAAKGTEVDGGILESLL